MKHRRFNGFLVLTFLFALMAGKVYAHNALVSSVPASGATVATASELKLGFNAPVRLVRLTLMGADSKETALDFTPGTTAQQDYALPLPALSAGMYTVNWTLIGTDGHTVSDKFSFNVDAGASGADHGNGHGNHAGHGAGDHGNHADHADHADHSNHANHANQPDHSGHHAAPAAGAAPAPAEEHRH
jgi:copper resistance protein C